MEGPSLFLAKEQLRPFKRQPVTAARGNTKAFEPETLIGLPLKDVFAWGKHLVFQFENFALRFHFLMFGTFEAQVDGVWVTGDYRRAREPRLSLAFPNGEFNAFSCSIRVIQSRNAKEDYDSGIDIMSPAWDEARVRRLLRSQPDEQIADVLLDQEVFAGVGNIIKNEVLAIVRVAPTRKVRTISSTKLREIVAETRAFSKQFYRWRKKFALRKHLLTHRRAVCRHCGRKLLRAKTGRRQRWSYWCKKDQC
jgi:endonuclease VIII